MKRPSVVPSPVKHPNAYAAFSAGTVATLLTYEAKTRLGFELADVEAMFLASIAISIVLFLGRKVSGGSDKSDV